MVENRDYYFSSEIPGLLNDTTPSYTTFYRCVKAEKIRKFIVAGQDVYSKSDVDAFLQGDLTAKKRGGSKRSARSVESGKVEANHAPVSSSLKRPIIDYVRERSDLAYVFLFLMEALERGEDTLLPKVTLSWIEENGWAYWFLSNPLSKEDIWASLGLLPLKEETIFRLLRNEIKLQDVTAADILSYDPSVDSYSCYLFVTSKPEHANTHVDSLVQIFQKVLTFLCEKSPSIRMKKVYLSVPYGVEVTPSRLMIKDYYFSPLYHLNQSAWVLDLEFATPSIYVQKLQECFDKKKEENSMLVVAPEKQQEDVKQRGGRRERDESSNIGGYARYLPVFNGQVSVIQFTKHKAFRTTSSDDDIRGILEINASHFGRSTRPEADLIRTRRSWIEKNPEVFHVLEVSREFLLQEGIYSLEELEGVEKKIVGFLSMLPLPEDTIAKLVRSEVAVSQIKGDDIVPYQPGVPVDLFVQTLAVHDEIRRRSEKAFTEFGRDLTKGLMGMFSGYGEQGIEIRLAHARSDTPFGKSASLGFDFEKVPSPAGVEKDVFLLNIRESKLPLLRDYVAAVQRYKETHGLITAS
jgi:hypothetical protein